MPNSFLPEEPFVEKVRHGWGVLVRCVRKLKENKGILHKNASCWFTFWENSTINVKADTTHLMWNSYPTLTDPIKKCIYFGFHASWWSFITRNAHLPLSDKALHKLFCTFPWFLSHHIDPSIFQPCPLWCPALLCPLPTSGFSAWAFTFKCFSGLMFVHRDVCRWE